MTYTERQLLLLLADAVRCMANVGVLLPLIEDARNAISTAPRGIGPLQTAVRRDLEADISRMDAEARQSPLERTAK